MIDNKILFSSGLKERVNLLFILIVMLLCTGSVKAQQKPNIIFLLSDDQVNIATGCYGNKQLETPNMDRLAKEGVLFANHYNTSSICMASRASIMTGMYEYKTGCNFMHGNMQAEMFQRTYPVILQEAGYYTGFAGKFGFELDSENDSKIEDGLPIGYFNNWAGGPGQTHYTTAKNIHIAKYAGKYPHSSRAYGAWAGDFLKEAKQSGKPFCMSISFKAPHLPFTSDAYFDHVYADRNYKKPDNYGRKNAIHLAPQAKTGRQYKSYNFWRESEESYQEAIQKYNQLIHGVDYAIGMIRKHLEELGLSENTIIIFTSDNGYSCGAHSFAGKVLPYEEASKSPLIIFDPRLAQKKRGVKREIVSANIDMAPTILSLAGIEIPGSMDGENLLPLLKTSDAINRNSVCLLNMWGNDEIQEMSVVTKDWKYIYWQFEDKRMKPTEELFNVGNDRLEMENLAANNEYQYKLKEMRKLYDKHFTHLVENAVDFNDYRKYEVLFNRKENVGAKASYLRGTVD